MAVVFAMLASYVLSRTIVPTLVRYLLASEAHGPVDAGAAPSVFRWLHGGFQRRFERLRTAYVGALENALARRRRVFGVFAVIAVSGAVLLPFIGRDFFPTVDTGPFRLPLPAPIDVQVTGFNRQATHEIALEVAARMARIPGAADVHLHQVVNTPSLLVNVDRSRAAELGLTQRDVANTMLVTLSSSAVVAPNYWSDPRNGINYIVAVQTPQSRVDSVTTLMKTSVTPGTAGPPQLLSNLATLERREVPAVISHSNVQPVFDVYANVQDSDLGSVATAVQQIAAELRPKLPPGHTIALRGQVESMNSAFLRLGLGRIC